MKMSEGRSGQLSGAMANAPFTTIFVQDPNGGQPQVIKVIGAKPSFGNSLIGVSSSGNSTSCPTTSSSQPQLKTFYRTLPSMQQDQGVGGGVPNSTLVQSGKLANSQILTVQARPSGATGSPRPLVLPIGSLIQNSSNGQHQLVQQSSGTAPIRQYTPLPRPVVIRTQTGTTASNGGQQTGAKVNTVNRPGVLHTSLQSLQLQQQLQQQLKTQQEKQHQLVYQTTQQDQQHNVQHSIKLEPSNNLPQQQFLIQQQPSQQQQQQQQQQSSQILVQQAPQQQIKFNQASPNNRQHASPPKAIVTTAPILDHTAARKRHDFDFDYNVDNKRRKTEKGGKGLRHFSMKVCEKVKAKGRTSYNEVADELVAEFCDPTRCNAPGDVNDDQKNIRRRVYDALNVLMAMDIISKEKKEIRWLGLPTNTAQECRRLSQERTKRAHRIRLKTQQLHDLVLQQIAFRRLVARNRAREVERGPPSANTAVQLPFVVVATANTTTIDCSIANDKTEYLFNFDGTFEVHDDIEVLKRMGLALGLDKGKCTPAGIIQAKAMLPKALESYVDDLAAKAPEPRVLSRDELVQQLGGVAIAGGEFGSQAGGGLLVMETTDTLGGALGGVQRLTTEGGVLEGKVARSLALGGSAASPASSVAGEDFLDDSDVEAG